MKVSVIIPVYNEEKQILRCLASLEQQKDCDLEIIVVDDGSTDQTLHVLSELQIIPIRAQANYALKGASKLQILKQNHLGAGAARNLGAKKAKGEILVFVDADMTFDKNFIRNLVRPIIKGGAKGTFSKEEYVSNWDNVWARCWNLNEGLTGKRRLSQDYPDEQKVFRAILKSEFTGIGGFTPGGYTDDYSLYDKLGYMAMASPNALFYHENPSTLAEVFSQAKWAGKREYKLGGFGVSAALVRSSFPISLALGILKSFKSREVKFIIFKIIYDLGVFLGICEFVLWKKGAK